MAIGKSLRDYRNLVKFTQAELAADCSLSVDTIRKLERGRGRLRHLYSVLQKLELRLYSRDLPADNAFVGLFALAHRRGFTQRGLSRLSGLSRSTISELKAERGRLDSLIKLAGALGVQMTVIDRTAPVKFFNSAAISSQHQSWETPNAFLQRLHSIVEQFDLDPCAPNGSRKRRVKARHYLTEFHDGLSQPWWGKVFVNPPYGRALRDWMHKCRSEGLRDGVIVFGLVPARTDARWWHENVAGAADIFMLKGRLKFGDGKNSAPFPSALVIWGADNSAIKELQAEFEEAWCIRANRTELGIEV